MQATDEATKKRTAEEMGDAMKSLENRTLDSKREMDILAALDEMKSMKVYIDLSEMPFVIGLASVSSTPSSLLISEP